MATFRKGKPYGLKDHIYRGLRTARPISGGGSFEVVGNDNSR